MLPLSCLLAALVAVTTTQVDGTPIPRELLFSDGKYAAVSLSPDGRFYAYIAPDETTKVKNVFMKCVSCKSTRQITFEGERDILSYSFTGVRDIILYTQDRDGDENTMIFKKNISTEALVSDKQNKFVVSAQPMVKALIVANNQETNKVLIGLNDEIPAFHNVYSFDLLTNELQLYMRNQRFLSSLVFDHDMNVRLASMEDQNGDIQYLRRISNDIGKVITSNENEWADYITVKADDRATTAPITFDKKNELMYWLWGADSDLGTLVSFNFDTPEDREVLYTAMRAQIGRIFFHPADKTLLAVTEIYHKPELLVANTTVMEDLQYLVNLRPHGSLEILSMSKDMHTWLITYESADHPHEVFLYRRWMKKAELLFNTHPQLEPYQLNKQVGFDFKARDDMLIQAYLSLPPQARLLSGSDVPAGDKAYADMGMIPAQPQKMVLYVHGGPKARDNYGFSPLNAWLTSRGYAVLQVNFRGSVGFGKKLTNSGNGEWGRKMHYDLLDAVEFAVAKGIAQRNQIAIMGGSYGGYASLVGLTFTPEVFACGVDIVGPSNLMTLIQTIPPYWAGFRKDLIAMLGADLDTEAGRQSLVSRSPLFFADKVTKPLMILQGANDPRVRQQESDQFVEAMKKNNIPITYVLYPDEGHGFRKANNRLAQSGYIEHFLNSCLGGEYETFVPGQYKESAILKEDGYAPKASEAKPTLAPQLFYRPMMSRVQIQPARPNGFNPRHVPTMNKMFPQFG